MKRVLFVDRDGTILVEPQDEQIDSFEKMKFLPRAISSLGKIANETDYYLVMVTNQDGLGTKSFPEKTFWPAHNLLLRILESEGIIFDDILIDRTLPTQNAPTRKPRTGLLEKYINDDYDLARSFVIGDRKTDMELAKNLECQAIFVNNKRNKAAVLSTDDWDEIYRFLVLQPRTAEIKRKTSETDIHIRLNLDGKGKMTIKSKLGFLKHTLELTAKHSGIDIYADINGDLEVDEHHTVEDTAIVLGQALRQALGSKKGINRYGFLLPMDEAKAEVAIDFSGRSFLHWDVKFKRERVGDVPTELFAHFFRSFCDHAACNLHIKARGKNEHHKIEAVFKGFARAIKYAIKKDEKTADIPSTKGVL
jgi:imidazoleglycerol-phosphate dehydratase/histidinol-phosphatase